MNEMIHLKSLSSMLEFGDIDMNDRVPIFKKLLKQMVVTTGL
jgi:hypothetical protein